MKISNFDAIKSLDPNAELKCNNDDIDSIKWLNGTKEISKDTILAEVKRLQTDYDSKKYQRDRETSYPSIQEQLDMQYWDAVNGTKKWQEAVAKVKTDNPKPE